MGYNHRVKMMMQKGQSPISIVVLNKFAVKALLKKVSIPSLYQGLPAGKVRAPPGG